MENHIIIKSIKLSYFKGVKSLNMNFGPSENFIYGKNEGGKTTVFDSLWYLFFGKDSTGRSDFSVKTLDKNNEVISKVDHEVVGVFEINGQTKTFKRTYKEQWSKSTDLLTGHTTDYDIDGYPVRKESDYIKEVEEFFKEELFKLLTNPLFFNSMKPAERRSTLISLVPEIGIDQVFESLSPKKRKSTSVQKLEALLTEGKTLDQIKQKAALDKRNLKEEKESIPGRIDEASRSKPEVYEFQELSEMIAEKKADLNRIDGEILAENNEVANSNKAIQEIQNQVFGLKTKLQKLEFQAEQEFAKWKNEQEKYPSELKAKIKELKEELADAEQEFTNKKEGLKKSQVQISHLNEVIKAHQSDKAKLVDGWKVENKKTFTWNGSTCTACDRPLEGASALNEEEKSRARFNTAKAQALKEIESKGNAFKSKIEDAQKEITEYEGYLTKYQAKISAAELKIDQTKESLITLESSLMEHLSKEQVSPTAGFFLSDEADDIKAKITVLENKKPEEVKSDNSSLIAEKATVQNALEGLQKALGNKEIIERTDARITELKAKEVDLAQSITDAEGMEHACFEFSKTRVEMIEAKLNGKFSLVSFKLFYMPINGSEKEICETLYKGVPFADLNTAGKIQAGLDIINTLSDHYEMYLPIFIDNRESTTWIPDVKSQTVNMVVDSSKEKLTIVSQELEIAALSV
jgi:exonuclease SbcC